MDILTKLIKRVLSFAEKVESLQKFARVSKQFSLPLCFDSISHQKTPNLGFAEDSKVFVYETMVRRSLRSRKHKHNENEDIISNLTDCILIHVLSFLNAKEAAQTCILSKRWITLWKGLPTITLSSSNFRTEKSLAEFLSHFLSLRDGSTTIHTLDVHCLYYLEPSLFQMIIKYAISHNVQHLLMNFPCRIDLFPSCFFSCHTLTSLNLSGYDILFGQIPIFPKNLNLPALTSLSLKYFSFHRSDAGCVVEPFSTFNMLNRLIIDSCIVQDAQNLCISSTKLVNLTIIMHDCEPKTIIGTYFGLELYAPSLQTFAFSGPYTPKLFASKNVLSSIKHVNIHVTCYWNSKARETSPVLLNWLVVLTNIESLTICLYTLEVLSLVRDLLKVEFPSLFNLKSLKLKTPMPSSKLDKRVDFLIQNSPSTKVDIIHL
ncbi:F-box/LRR-repeat protein At3g26922 isoform X2 [Medicago truncatula]|uniref:F-box/RNI superfamily protein, putative n=1 Tax=Medicago truncatula TaxID=3880 RepID=G7II28_MEDTR|nr:F-box/LRR-repeat protein At3g26922 isoform X2 [Medicago truncatula]AES68010.2 F-box/RNI superfamily protein, putative [Medicago truncatula]